MNYIPQGAPLATAEVVNDFIFAGKSTVTLRNAKSGNRFTYKVKRVKDKEIFFVSLMTGSDNEASFSFIGTIFDGNTFVYSGKSQVSKSSVGYKAFCWVFNRLVTGGSLETVTVWHEGKCARCSRKLTVPESIETGFGPECVKLNKKRVDKFTSLSLG